MRLNNMRLKWKVFFYLLGFCALLLVILWVFQTMLLDVFYRNIRVMRIKQDAAYIERNINGGDLRALLETVSEQGEFGVAVTDMNGVNILEDDPPELLTGIVVNERRASALTAGLLTERNAALIAMAIENGGEYVEYADFSNIPDRDAQTEIIISREITGTDDRAAYPRARPAPVYRSMITRSLNYVRITEIQGAGETAIIINAVISPVDATVTTLRYQLYVVSGVMLLLAVILAVLMARRVSKPIEDINKSAARLAKGHYDTRFSGKGFYEIAELSETLNTAAFELGRAESLRRELLANVSHDLRTPLALIYGCAEMMSDFPGEITDEQIKVIMAETRRLTLLVNDILELSKLESGIDTLNITRFNLTEMITETTARVRELTAADGFAIEFKADPDSAAYISADRQKTERAFYNLLLNAVNYSGDSRRISVEQTVSEKTVRISVTDCGEGIADGDLPYIWDRYYKSGAKHKRAVTGTGLGLSIVKKIIEAHGGSCGARTEAGSGSVFWFEMDLRA